MNDDATIQLQGLIDRMRAGDVAARYELLERAGNRLRRLAGKMLTGSFPAVGQRHELDSVVHETWLRLLPALEKTDPPTVADFFRLAAHKVRQVLLDMAERQRKQGGREVHRTFGDTSGDSTAPAAGEYTHDPTRLALWTEFHDRVATLAEQERAVFELHYYLELPQAEIAGLLGLPPRQVSRLWIAATDKLADALAGAEELP
jgi:RNA polymerase sigma factor (sigma-70 family)